MKIAIIIAIILVALIAALVLLLRWGEKQNYRFTTYANVSDIGASKFGFRRFIVEYTRKGRHYIVQSSLIPSILTAKRRKVRFWDIHSVKDKDGNIIYYAKPAIKNRKDTKK